MVSLRSTTANGCDAYGICSLTAVSRFIAFLGPKAEAEMVEIRADDVVQFRNRAGSGRTARKEDA